MLVAIFSFNQLKGNWAKLYTYTLVGGFVINYYRAGIVISG
jgi:hypothetical protein